MKSLGVVTIIALILVLFVAGPVFSIMALNTLFGLGIPFNFGTWLAAFWLTVLFASQKNYGN